MMSGLFYIPGMAYEEQRAWITGACSAAGYAVYLALVLGRVLSTPVSEVAYVAILLWTVGATIAVTILVGIAVGIATRQEAGRPDERDREIDVFGQHIGRGFVVIGAVAAMLLALAEADHFWIANAVLLMFVLSAVTESASKIFAYRRGFQPW
jgi:hypothetical protein